MSKIFQYPISYQWRVLRITWADYKESWSYSFQGKGLPKREKDGAVQKSVVPLTKEQKEEEETNETLREFVKVASPRASDSFTMRCSPELTDVLPLQTARDVWSELRQRRKEKKETVEDIKESLVDLKTTLKEISDTASQVTASISGDAGAWH